MTLRNKAIVIVGGTTLALIIVLFVLGNTVLTNSFLKTEEVYARQNVQRALKGLSNESANLQAVVRDLGAWDDTYAFIKDTNQGYLQANLGSDAFARLQVNFIFYLDIFGKTVFARAFDLNSGKERPLPPGLEQQLNTPGPLLAGPDAKSGVSGFLFLPTSPLLVASYPILTSQSKGPVRGTVIVGRYLGTSLIEQLSQQIQLPLTIVHLTDAQMQASFPGMVSSGDKEASILVRPQDSQTVSGYALLKDIYGQPSLILRVDMPRDIYQQGRTAITYFSIIVAAIGIESFLVVWWLLERQILARLGRIITDVGDVGNSSNLSTRIRIDGKDELTKLTGSINQMLSSLEQTQNRIVESEEKYKSLVDNVSLGIFRATPDSPGKFLEVNSAMEEITGYSRAELLQMDVSRLYIHPEERETLINELSSSQHKITKELNFRKKDGVVITVADTKTPIRDGSGKVLYFDGILEDITERKRTEEEMQRLYQHEQALRLSLEEEIAKRTEFTRALVHELRTPLTPILASSDLLAQELKDGPVARLAKNIYEGAIHLNRRVEELLDLARGEIGMLQLSLLPVDPLKTIQDIFNQVAPLAASNGQTLTVELPPSLPSIKADEERVRQILLNLVNNSIKFTPAGGKVILRAREEGDGIVVEVTDTGRGMNEKEMERLFQPYTRSERDSQRLSGLGLGLSLAKRLVELHNGRIWVESQVGKGSTFSFFLPMDPDKSSQKEKKA